MLEKLVRCRVVLVKLLRLGVIRKFEVCLEAARSWTDRGENVRLITHQSQIGKMWTWICSHVGLANISTPQLHTTAGGRERRAELSFFSQTQGSGESASSSEDRVRGREVLLHGGTRLEKWCFPSQLPALPGNKLDSPDLC